ncbi:MAG: hypothetical protein AB8G99_26190 [Planctomycetaceae bacterium]
MSELLEGVRATWWVPRWHCGWFPWWLIAIYVIANAVIWLSYEHIPFVLARLEKNQKRLFSDDDQSRQFVTFIRSCGRGHLLDGVLVFVWPNYFVFACWHAITAVVSVRTSLSLNKLGDQLLSEKEREAVLDISETIRGFDEGAEEAELREIMNSLKSANETIERIFGE